MEKKIETAIVYFGLFRVLISIIAISNLIVVIILLVILSLLAMPLLLLFIVTVIIGLGFGILLFRVYGCNYNIMVPYSLCNYSWYLKWTSKWYW